LGVVTTAMVRVDKCPAARNRVFRTVTKFECRLAQAERRYGGPVRNQAEGQDDSVLRKLSELGLQETVTGANFFSGWFVFRWQAFYGIRDPAIAKLETIVSGNRLGDIGEPMLVQRPVKKNSGKITGKRPTRSIRPVHARGESDDQQFCLRVAEWRYWSTVVAGEPLAHVCEVTCEAFTIDAMNIELWHWTQPAGIEI